MLSSFLDANDSREQNGREGCDGKSSGKSYQPAELIANDLRKEGYKEKRMSNHPLSLFPSLMEGLEVGYFFPVVNIHSLLRGLPTELTSIKGVPFIPLTIDRIHLTILNRCGDVGDGRFL